ncbi:hypothetical protein SUSAZ_08835 [Sulfolobus acidocaldarius SUSAZ]|nr:hypothetical protein SUSAZ_08835 [Sulfolobus acidocaldarius SUSAZ]
MINEHFPIITGKSTYIDDISPKNVVYLHVIRSSIARGVIKSISKPSNALLALTWDDIKSFMSARLFPGLTGAQVARMPVLTNGKVIFVGQPVLAFVVDDKRNVSRGSR